MHVHGCVYAQGMSVQKGICTVCVSVQGSLLRGTQWLGSNQHMHLVCTKQDAVL